MLNRRVEGWDLDIIIGKRKAFFAGDMVEDVFIQGGMAVHGIMFRGQQYAVTVGRYHIVRTRSEPSGISPS